MNELKIFENEDFGQLRAVEIRGEPWFVVADVCKPLGIGNPSDAIRRLEDDEHTLVSIEGTRNGVPVNVVNEPGLYSLTLGSRKKQARAFKRWVTHEVLPSIRKHGGYLTPEKVEEMLVNPRAVADLLYRLQDERDARKRLEEENAAQAERLEIAAPKADYYDNFVDARTSTNFRVTAKEIGVPERKFVNLLIEKGFLYRDKQGGLLPHANRNRDYFIVRDVATGRWMGKQTYITEKGKHHFRRLCEKAGLLPSSPYMPDLAAAGFYDEPFVEEPEFLS